MLRQLLRVGVLAGALVSALAFSGNALAAPTTPQLHPIPDVVHTSTLTVSWSPSVFTPGVIASGYRLDVRDLSSSTIGTPIFTQATSVVLSGLQMGHTYRVRVRAWEVYSNFDGSTSNSDLDVFYVGPKLNIKEFYDVEFKFPPDPPWCLTCPYFDKLVDNDPVLYANRSRLQVVDSERIVGVYVDLRGEVTAIHG